MILRRIALGAAVLVVLLAGSPSHGAWCFNSVYTFTPARDGVDGRFYEADGQTLVNDGALAQFIVGIHGAPIVDPLEYFDGLGNGSGSIDTPAELSAVRSWLNSGADPAAISNGTNVLASDLVVFTGEFELVGGSLYWDRYTAPGWGVAPIIRPGWGTDLIGIRVWNLTKGELLDWGSSHGQEVWYNTDREFGHGTGPYAPDAGMCVGAGYLAPGVDALPRNWGLNATIGAEVYEGYRDMNRLDHYLGSVAPEPALVPLIGAGLLLLALRRRK